MFDSGNISESLLIIILWYGNPGDEQSGWSWLQVSQPWICSLQGCQICKNLTRTGVIQLLRQKMVPQTPKQFKISPEIKTKSSGLIVIL